MPETRIASPDRSVAATGSRADGGVAELRAEIAGDIPLAPAAHAVIEAWRSGAPFGLALTGDPQRAEEVFRSLRPQATRVVRRADADAPSPETARVLALCLEGATLPPTVRRLCTAVVDVGGRVAPGRRPAGEDEAGLWRRVIRVLAAHGVRDGAIDVAACVLASTLVAEGWKGDPVTLVRAMVAVPHGRAMRPNGDSDGGGADGASDEEPDGTVAGDPSGASTAASEGDAADDGEGETGPGGSRGEEQPADARETAAPEAGDGGEDASADPDPATDEAAEEVPDASAEDGGEALHEAGDPRAPTSEAAPATASADGAPEAGVVTHDPDENPFARAVALADPTLSDTVVRATVRAGRSARRGAMRAGSGRGRPGRVVALERAGGRIAILPTLQRALRRHATTGATGELALDRDDLRGRLRNEPTASHTVIVVDGSSSMGTAGAAHARRVADAALAHVYRDRGDVSIVLAAGSFSRVVQQRTARTSRARAALERASAEGGGGTPLADAVRCALEQFGDAPRERCRLVIVSDGHATVDLVGRADPSTATADLRAELDRATARAARTVFVPLDPRGWAPLERTLAPFRAAGVTVSPG
ncbi:VWA domain-containing protein [Microbacterium testaceum]|uniref:VWA domain-containing protein n=1 Tax=Microbacterium testaceum TaxID=2033 RepID=UPI002AC79A1F|nr:VWA domain-containing protein [Microbacterium testaceum]MDZ5143204.1 VWA domain-containing protein [Microbacterium testaceum]